ncbi:GntR family transcriptional regulator [Cryobacterium mesophilum]|uniref:GntR family transcriptional regulator n=1 Tax=Terrimesophilobacter mesophilus TaxID=433647 RepID=UPI0017A7EACC|nr:GntR family transcriptional regulator [Terrimesophilobacter mesophilus]MBB5633008.1 GntR family transcriptional regulator [Terrimesophilobacter mesophilus]
MPIVEASTRHSVRARLRELVAAANVGDRLPSERDLSVRWGVARMTLRRAVDTLVAEGIVERRHGSGTYVTPQPFVRMLGLTSFSQDMRDRGLIPSSRLLAFRVIPADGTLAGQLRIPIGDPVLSFTRLRTASGDAMAVESVWIPQKFVPGLGGSDLGGSLYELLAERYRITTGAAKVSIEPVLPEPRVRELLTLDEDQACLRIRMVDSDTRGQVIMIANCVYRGDRYQLSADITGAAFLSAAVRRAG